jgi:hypothetical protein
MPGGMGAPKLVEVKGVRNPADMMTHCTSFMQIIA